MTDISEAAERNPRVQRHPRHLQAGEQRRRLQFGTPYPHRGPAPACQQRQRTYQRPKPGQSANGASDEHRPGRLRVLNTPPAAN